MIMKLSTTKYQLFLVLLAYIITSGFQCNKCEENINNIATFKIDISPLNAIVKVGDTLWISCDFDSDFELENSVGKYNNSNSSCEIDFNIMRIISDNEKVKDGVNYFDINIIDGNFYSANNSIYNEKVKQTLNFSCSNSNCEFKFGVICKNKGYFGFKVWGGQFGLESNSDCESNRFENINFNIERNNFDICNEINTNKLFVYEKKRTWSTYSNLDEGKNFYFFKVE